MEEKVKKRRFKRPKKEVMDDIKNPFINPTFQIPVNRVTANQGLFKVVDGLPISAEKEIFREQHKFVKIYTDVTLEEEDENGNPIITNSNLLKSSLRKDRAKLSSKAVHLLFWIMEELRSGQDYVVINKDRYMNEADVGSINTVKAAIKELQDRAFIAPASAKDTYFINPLYMFKGDRTKKYPNNIIES